MDGYRNPDNLDSRELDILLNLDLKYTFSLVYLASIYFCSTNIVVTWTCINQKLFQLLR